MDDSLFDGLVKSLEEVKEYVEGKKKLRTKKVNAAECTSEKIEDEEDIGFITVREEI
jgi:hypothetical protein